MKIPLTPPEHEKTFFELSLKEPQKGFFLLSKSSSVDSKGAYHHWDEMRFKTPPDGFTVEQWWAFIKIKRLSESSIVPFKSKDGVPFLYTSPPSVKRDLHWLDLHAAGSLTGDMELTDSQIKNTYIIRSLVNEAITSSQLEGATTTGDLAKEMIRTERKPRDKSEQMILNNYNAMRHIRNLTDKPLSQDTIKELQRILTAETMEDPYGAGNYRRPNDEIHVFDDRDGSILFTPPKADELPERMEALCKFANSDESGNPNDFIHPVIKGIILHFMLSYNHPFKDGNGRTARALFYWYMARRGYWLMEYISISEIIKKAPIRYGRAFLYTETDGNDLTYFIIHQLDVIRKAIQSLHTYLEKRKKERDEALTILDRNQRLRKELNFRQLELLKHAIKNPNHVYTVLEHCKINGIVRETARKDLLMMSDKFKLLEKKKRGKTFVFVSPANLRSKVTREKGSL